MVDARARRLRGRCPALLAGSERCTPFDSPGMDVIFDSGCEAGPGLSRRDCDNLGEPISVTSFEFRVTTRVLNCGLSQRCCCNVEKD